MSFQEKYLLNQSSQAPLDCFKLKASSGPLILGADASHAIPSAVRCYIRCRTNLRLWESLWGHRRHQRACWMCYRPVHCNSLGICVISLLENSQTPEHTGWDQKYISSWEIALRRKTKVINSSPPRVDLSVTYLKVQCTKTAPKNKTNKQKTEGKEEQQLGQHRARLSYFSEWWEQWGTAICSLLPDSETPAL